MKLQSPEIDPRSIPELGFRRIRSSINRPKISWIDTHQNSRTISLQQQFKLVFGFNAYIFLGLGHDFAAQSHVQGSV